MGKESKNIERRLKYVNDFFPGLDWDNFLRECGVDCYTNRKDRCWHAIRGKGFIIWMTSFYGTRNQGETIWYSDIELNKNVPQAGKDTLEEFLHGAIARFDKMELGEPEE